MSSYYMRDGQLFTTKTCCNLVEFWQHEARVYPDEEYRAELKTHWRRYNKSVVVPMSWGDFEAMIYDDERALRQRDRMRGVS